MNPPPAAKSNPAIAASSNGHTILVVDDDKVARRYLEVTLSRMGNYRVEVANDAAGALDVLRTAVIDLILSDISMPDMDGFQFLQRVRRDPRFKHIPFVFVSADSRVATKVGGLQMGIDDYITKPFEMSELKARIDAIFRRLDAYKAAASRRSYNLAGDFTGVPFPELINILNLGRRTGRLTVVTPHAMSEILFDQGEMVHATYGNVEGNAAFFKLMNEPQGHFEFCPGTVDRTQVAKTVTNSCAGLLLEAARRIDHTNAEASPQLAGKPTRNTRLLTLTKKTRAASPVTPALKTELEAVVANDFSLGEMQLFTEQQLRDWTHAPQVNERFHVLLLADLAEGVSTLSALASPLGESQILRAIKEETKALGLVFQLRGDAMADIVLVDLAHAAGFTESLMRSPSLAIIAPMNGDWLGLGAQARKEIASLLRRVDPVAMIGLGNASGSGGLEDIQTLASNDAPRLYIPAHLGEAGADMREVLRQGVQFWATLPSVDDTAGAGVP